MKYIDFRNKIGAPTFTSQDIRALRIRVYPHQLTEWTRKGYLFKLKRGIFAFSDRRDQLSIEYISFLLYQPSYISLEWALSHHGLIPEMVYMVTAVTSKTTRTFENEFGLFSYRHLKRNLFFGYERIDTKEGIFLLAEPEKALLDYLYLNLPKINDEDDLDAIRLNPFELEGLDNKKLKNYAAVFQNKKIDYLLELLIK